MPASTNDNGQSKPRKQETKHAKPKRIKFRIVWVGADPPIELLLTIALGLCTVIMFMCSYLIMKGA